MTGVIRKNRELLFLAVILAATLVVVFYPYILQNNTFLPTDEFNSLYKPYATDTTKFDPHNHFDDDILRWYYEWKHYQQKHLYLPYWSPNVFGGTPWYANTYAAHFGSTNWILKLGPLEKMYPFQLIFQLWIAGVAMAVLLLSFRLGFWAVLIFSAAYMLNSMFTTLLLRWWLHGAFCWVPLIIWALIAYLKKPNILSFSLCSLFLALSFTDGFIQSSALILMMLAAFSLVWKGVGQTHLSYPKIILSGLAIVIFAFALSAIMWLPMLEYFYLDIAKGSSRSSGEVFGKSFLQRLMSIPFLLSFLMPQLIGSVRSLDLAKLINSHLQDFTGFIGSLGFFFFAAAAALRKNLTANARGFLYLAIFGLAVPIVTPLDRYVYFRFLIVYIFSASVLGAFLYDHFTRGTDSLIWSKPILFFHGISAIVFGGLVFVNIAILMKGQILLQKLQAYLADKVSTNTIGSRNPEWLIGRAAKFIDHYSFFSATIVWPLVLLATINILLALKYRKKISANIFGALVFLVTVLELTNFIRSWHGIIDLAKHPVFADAPVIEFLRKNAQSYRTYVDDYIANKDGVLQKQILPTNSPVILGYHALQGFDGLQPNNVFYVPHESYQYNRLGQLNVKYILASPTAKPAGNDLTRVYDDGNVAVFENKWAKPRARIYYNYELATQAESHQRMKAENKLDTMVYLEKAPSIVLSKNRNASDATSIVSESDNEITYKFSSEEDGIFVASETFYPGWKAYLDGAEVAIDRANFAMRAIVVPKGSHQLKFEFVPAIFDTGKAVSLVAFALFVFLVAASGVCAVSNGSGRGWCIAQKWCKSKG